MQRHGSDHARTMILRCVVLALALPLVAQAKGTLKGWVQSSYTASSALQTNLPQGYNTTPNDFQLPQAWVMGVLPLRRGAAETDAHIRVDMFVGTDYQFTNAAGLFSKQTSRIGFDPLQFYLEGRIPTVGEGTDLRLGRFYSPTTNEWNDAPLNTFASHSYIFTTTPATHTGLYGVTHLANGFQLLTGFINGNDVWIGEASTPTFCGGVNWEKPGGGAAIQLFSILGPGRFDAAHGVEQPNLIDLVANFKISERWNGAFNAITAWHDDVPDLGDTKFRAVCGYLAYSLTEKSSVNFRAELFGDPQGERTGTPGTYRSTTLNYRVQLDEHWVLRPEIRYDATNGDGAFEGRDHLSTACADILFLW